MEFIRLNSADSEFFESALHIYNSSFPLCERRDRACHIEAMRDERFHCEVVLSAGQLVGLVWYWLFEGESEPYIFVEHIAITESARGKGLGTTILEHLKAQGLTIILEIEPPTEPLARRRECFYQRAGFVTCNHDHYQPPYRATDTPLKLCIMSYPHTITDAEYRTFATAQCSVMQRYLKK